MDDKNKKIKRNLSSTLTSKGLSILLVFSFIVTALAFAVAYNEHQKIMVLSQKYDEAIVKISNCEDVLGALVQQMESTAYSEITVQNEQEETTTQEETAAVSEESAVAPTEENIYPTRRETTAVKTETTQTQTEKAKTTTKAQSTSGPYFVTQSGKKYHIGSCSYLNKSKIPISWERINAEGYTPCSRCIK